MEVFLEQVGIQLNYTRELLIVALILGRTMPMVYLTPFLAGQIAPTEVKIGFELYSQSSCGLQPEEPSTVQRSPLPLLDSFS